MNTDTTKTMSVEDMLMLIPFEQSFKVELLNKLATIDSERRMLVEATIQDLYASIVTLKFEQNLQSALTDDHVSEFGDLSKQVMEQTKQEMLSQLPKADTNAAPSSLSDTRQKLQEVIQEKQQSS